MGNKYSGLHFDCGCGWTFFELSRYIHAFKGSNNYYSTKMGKPSLILLLFYF